MATFSTNAPVNFLADFSLLELVNNTDNYTTQTADLITVSDGGLLFESKIDMAGSFIYMPDMIVGDIASLTFTIQPQGFQYAITGLDLNLNELRSAAAGGAVAALEKIFEGNDTVYGSTAGDDVLKGYGGADWIYGDTGEDSLDGGADDDHLFGGLGNDSLDGGAGNDTLTGNADNDALTGGAGNDGLFGGDGVDTASYSEKNAAVVVTLNGSSEAVVFVNGVAEDTIREIENIVGGDSNDVLTGDALANALTGGDGEDTLNGMDGDDALFGGAGNDALDGGGGNDNLSGGAGNDVLSGAEGDDFLSGGAGADVMNGGEGDDLLTGGSGADVMDGGAGIDTASYFTVLPGAGDVAVTLNGANAAALFINGAAEDTLLNIENVTGGDGNDSLTGDDLANIFLGNSGNDALFGMKGNDTLYGGAGSDTLSGGKGLDLLIGGEGTDSFVFDAKLNKKKNVDTIDDFVVADDTIQLADNIFKKLDAGALALKQFHIGNKAHDNNDRLIYNADKGKLYYDADGKKDGFDKVLVAKLDTGLAMTHEDFFVV